MRQEDDGWLCTVNWEKYGRKLQGISLLCYRSI